MTTIDVLTFLVGLLVGFMVEFLGLIIIFWLFAVLAIRRAGVQPPKHYRAGAEIGAPPAGGWPGKSATKPEA